MTRAIHTSRSLLTVSLSMCALVVQSLPGLAATTVKSKPTAWKEETSFTFAGKCFNGKNFWMFASEKIEDGQVIPYYTYTGPVGSGTVRTNAPPKVMAQRICREMADIADNL